MSSGNAVTVSVTNTSPVSVSVPGSTGTTPTITNGGTANVTVTSVGDRGPQGPFWVAVPSEPASSGTDGSVAYDGSFLYIKAAAGWRRVAIATWTPLGTPTAVTGTAGNAQVSLTWTAPAADGGYAITDYVVQSTTNNGTTWTTFSDGVGTAASATVTGLTNGTEYKFRVAAVNAIGTGPWSTTSAGVTPSA